MTNSKVKHAIFTIERTFKAPPKRVFAAWSTPEGKAAWFAGPAGESVEEIREFNFREGGTDRLRGGRGNRQPRFLARDHQPQAA